MARGEGSVTKLEPYFKDIAKTLARQKFEERYEGPAQILKLVGAGAFLATAVVAPGLGRALNPIVRDLTAEEPWRKYNIPYLKRSLARLEQQKLVVVRTVGTAKEVEITSEGKKRILRMALDELTIKKPANWDGYWRLVSYDIPKDLSPTREAFTDYLRAWGFYPFQESLYLQAYPCERPVEFLREYFGIGKYVRIIKVLKIENDQLFRQFFYV